MNLEKYQQYSRIARGLEKADLVLKDARIVNVFTEEIIRGLNRKRFWGSNMSTDKRSSAETLPYRMGL